MTAVISSLLLCVSVQLPTAPAARPVLPTKQPVPVTQNVVPQKKAKMTDAEQIANSQEMISNAKKAIDKIQKQLDNPDGEYPKAEAEFAALNTKLKDTKTKIQKYRADGDEKKAAELESTLTGLQEEWQLARERFDLAIRQKKESQEAIAALKERVATEKELLDRLEGKVAPPPTKPTDTPTPTPDKPSGEKSAATPTTPSNGGSSTSKDAPAKTEPVPPPAPGTVTALPGMTTPGLPGVTPSPTGSPAASPEVTKVPVEDDPLVKQLQDRLITERDTLHDVEGRVRLAQERIRAMERSIQTSTKSLEIEKESIANMEKAVANLQNNPSKNADEQDVRAVRLAETQERLQEAHDRVKRTTERITKFRETLAELKMELDAVTSEADARRATVTATEAEIVSLLSPIAPRNMLKWVVRKGPHLGLILVSMILLYLAALQCSRHIVRFITRNSDRGSPEDKENRAQTLVGVFRYAAGIIILGGGAVMLLDEMGIPVVPLMGGAAVLGLAVAFGAQNLIRDYFTGFMMLMEDQYSVNDVVKIGAIAGLVEQISLRMTVLRDLEGVRHFIPHGTITSVSNLTHGWSRAMIDIPVAYKENVDHVIEVLMQLGREMRQDPNLGRYILEEPEMLGVDALADSGVVIKFLLKTRPLRQWPIKRELLRRIKNRFDELGIEIPVPHRMVYHKYLDETQSPPDSLR